MNDDVGCNDGDDFVGGDGRSGDAEHGTNTASAKRESRPDEKAGRGSASWERKPKADAATRKRKTKSEAGTGCEEGKTISDEKV